MEIIWTCTSACTWTWTCTHVTCVDVRSCLRNTACRSTSRAPGRRAGAALGPWTDLSAHHIVPFGSWSLHFGVAPGTRLRLPCSYPRRSVHFPSTCNHETCAAPAACAWGSNSGPVGSAPRITHRNHPIHSHTPAAIGSASHTDVPTSRHHPPTPPPHPPRVLGTRAPKNAVIGAPAPCPPFPGSPVRAPSARLPLSLLPARQRDRDTALLTPRADARSACQRGGAAPPHAAGPRASSWCTAGTRPTHCPSYARGV